MIKNNIRHVKEDLERSLVPLGVHVDVEITKVKYADYDTFLGSETVQYLREYFAQRRRETIPHWRKG